MTYIPVVVPPVEAPSPRSRELAERLAVTIDEFERRHPSTTAHEVKVATQLALRSRARGENVAAVVAAVTGAVVLSVGIGVFVVARQSPDPEALRGLVSGLIVLIGIVVAGLVWMRRRDL